MVDIIIPKDNFVFDLQEFNHLDLEKKQGIYKFYSEDGTLLYVGKSTNIRSRIYQHLNRDKGNVLKEYKDQFRYLKGFYEESELDTALYEVFMINTLRPTLNVGDVYTYRSKRQNNKQAKKHLERVNVNKEYERRKNALLSSFHL